MIARVAIASFLLKASLYFVYFVHFVNNGIDKQTLIDRTFLPTLNRATLEGAGFDS